MSEYERSRCQYRPDCPYWNDGSGYYPEGCWRVGSEHICRAVYENGVKVGDEAATKRTLAKEGLAGGTHAAAAVSAPGVQGDSGVVADAMAGRADDELRVAEGKASGTRGDLEKHRMRLKRRKIRRRYFP